MVENLKVFNFLLIGLTFAVIVDFFVQMAEGYNSGDPLFTTIDELWTSSTMNPSNFGSTQHTNPSQFGTPQHHEHTPIHQQVSFQTSTPGNPFLSQQTLSSISSCNVTASSKVTLRKFSGYSEEDAEKFLTEFNSYCTFNNIFDDARRLAAFHLHLQGPALVWFNTLDKFFKASWTNLEYQFRLEYANQAEASLTAESAMFDALTLAPNQPLESFHSNILEKGTRLKKPDRDMTSKFINGLPSQLAFFVRANKVTSFREALTSAKLGEAYGYRTVSTVSAVQRTTVQKPTTKTNELHEQYSELSERLRKLEMARQHDHRQSRNTSSGTIGQRSNNIVCRQCDCPGHIQRQCNWNKRGTPRRNLKCQLCDQYGHTVKFCTRLPQDKAPGNDRRGPDVTP